MTGKRHGVDVETDTLRNALEPTRPLRHALDVLRGHPPPSMETDAIRDALHNLDQKLREGTLADLRKVCSPPTTSSSAPSTR